MTFVNNTGSESPSTINRSGVSPIGTVSPNTSAAANTNSSYSQGSFASGINYLGATTSYTLQNTDYQGIVLFNEASAVAITLNSGLTNNFTCVILNIGSGALTLTPQSTPAVYPINGLSSLALQSNSGCIVFFADRQWWAFAGVTFIPAIPNTFASVTHEWLNSYNASTGLFTATQPAFTDISGQITTSQLPSSGLSVTITTAKLTSGGANGSMTFTHGILTAQVAAT